MNKTNDRLGAALAVAKTRKRKNHKGLWTPSRGRKASLEYWSKKTVIPTTNMRLHTDAVELAKAAWKTSEERIPATSEAIRLAARKKLGI